MPTKTTIISKKTLLRRQEQLFSLPPKNPDESDSFKKYKTNIIPKKLLLYNQKNKKNVIHYGNV